jgi:hypothetical protein
VLGRALVGHVRLGREDHVGQFTLQATAGHGQAVPPGRPGCRGCLAAAPPLGLRPSRRSGRFGERHLNAMAHVFRSPQVASACRADARWPLRLAPVGRSHRRAQGSYCRRERRPGSGVVDWPA